MKIIYVAPHLSAIGGLERTLSDKANALVQRGHEVMLLTYSEVSTILFYPLDSRVLVECLFCPFHRLFVYPFFYRLLYYFRIRRDFRMKFHNVIETFSPDLIVVTVPNTEDYINDIMKSSCKAKIVIESHLNSNYVQGKKTLTEKLLFFLFPPINSIRNADLLIALTRQDAFLWEKRGVNRIKIVPNPLVINCSLDNNIRKKDNRIIAVGRLDYQKRYDRLLDSFSLIADKYSSWYIDIFGEGLLETEILHKIESLGLNGRVNLLKPVRDISLEYQRSQFLVLSSDYEGFGMVIVEAMACGIPVVSTDCPSGPSEIIEDGRSGLLSDMDIYSLASKIEWMIVHKYERVQMGKYASMSIEKYKIDTVINKWLDAYSSVLCFFCLLFVF